MKSKLMIFIFILMFIPTYVFTKDSEKRLDLSIKVPKEYSYIAIRYPSPIERYISGYKLGFKDVLENYKYKEEIKVEVVNGWGQFISGHSDGFDNALSQLRKFEKEMSEQEIHNLIEEYIGDESYL